MPTDFARSSPMQRRPSAPLGASWPATWSALATTIGTIARRLMTGTSQQPLDEQLHRAAEQERLRIAREIHDLVGHGLTVINLQAGVALHVIGQRPDQAVVALEAIKSASKDALEELRGTVVMLRQGDAAAPRPVAAGLDRLEELTAAMCDSGLPVRLEVAGEPPHVLPDAVGLAAYRIVQESLTNVLRHAGPATATVRVTHQPDAVWLEITDDGRAGARHNDDTEEAWKGRGGHGIRGMRERATAVGGTLEAGPRPGGGFRVRARLPSGRRAAEGVRGSSRVVR